MIELQNLITLEFDRDVKKEDVKKEVEEAFNVKVEKIRSLIKKNRKICYVKLDKKNPAIDVATKIGIM
jgi:large subunit ribosomal protein L23